MKFSAVCEKSLGEGAKILLNGGLVAFPTETVYGLGADAFNSQALARVFEVKKRPHFDPLIIHIAAIETLEKTANLSILSDETRKKLFLLAENFWPGPLSIILPKSEKIPGIATAGLPTAAIRFPDNETARKLISLSSGAVAAPSANPFGALSPTRAEHVRDTLGEKVDLILDGGATRIGVESTVLDITGERIKILRPGGTARDAIENVIKCKIWNDEPEIRNEVIASPGQLKSHYAPRTPLFILGRDEIIQQDYKTDDPASRTGFLFFDGSTRDAQREAQKLHDGTVIKVLSESGVMTEAASRLFEILHELDNCNLSRIYAQKAPDEGLGEAINDRLRRGANA
ncbi:MAG: L-threonylcarbamoyladenylate synthase [Treponema sp.]|nr:L-threonylcarbamoyladenylate synthase [Treponema sp.]